MKSLFALILAWIVTLDPSEQAPSVDGWAFVGPPDGMRWLRSPTGRVWVQSPRLDNGARVCHAEPN